MTGVARLAERAAALRALHVPGRPVVLANVWDAASARLVAAAGHPAVATSSGAVAESLGYADHEGAPADEMLAAAARIAGAVSVPVTVDAEAGYGLPADELVARLLAAGAVGCNLEDSDHAGGGLVDVGDQADRLAAVRAAAERAGVPLVLNARIDVFLHGRGAPDLVEQAVERARAYLAAGADCVYPILADDHAAIGRLIGAVSPARVNLLMLPGVVSVADAARLGAARVSLGTGLWRAAQAWLTDRLATLPDG